MKAIPQLLFQSHYPMQLQKTIRYYWSTSALTASTSDFSGNSNDPFTIASGTTGTVQMQLPIQITDDNYQENPETFTINLTRLRNALFPNSVDTYTITVTINDNEGSNNDFICEYNSKCQ